MALVVKPKRPVWNRNLQNGGGGGGVRAWFFFVGGGGGGGGADAQRTPQAHHDSEFMLSIIQNPTSSMCAKAHLQSKPLQHRCRLCCSRNPVALR